MAAEGGTPARRPGSYGLRVALQVPHTETFPRANVADALKQRNLLIIYGTENSLKLTDSNLLDLIQPGCIN